MLLMSVTRDVSLNALTAGLRLEFGVEFGWYCSWTKVVHDPILQPGDLCILKVMEDLMGFER